jgi:regulator of protease activity HflC (stomatin/prohibitin superfamily)
MSSQWMDPGSAEEPVTSAVWAAPQQERAAASSQQALFASDTFTSALEPEGDTDPLDEVSSSRLEALWLLSRQLSPILLPLLFGGITFLLLVPAALRGSAYLSHAGLFPAALILLAIAILHGVMLYYAGDHNVLWSLALVCGVALFLVAGAFAAFGPLVSLILLLVLLAVGGLLLRYAIHPVPEGYVDIVYSLGQYRRTLSPGPNFIWPWERVVHRLNTRRTQWSCPPQIVHLSPEEDVQLAATIAYQLMPEDAHLAVTEVNDWESSLQQLFLATIQAVVSSFSAGYFVARRSPFYDAAFEEATPRWDVVNTELALRMQDQVAGWGVQIHQVSIHDVALLPRGAAPLPLDTGAMERVQPVAASADVEDRTVPVQQRLAATAQPSTLSAAAPASPAASGSAAPPPKAIKEDVLVNTYNAVRDGRITDPETIRLIAARFEAIANDPELSKTVTFDAGRAARALQQRADLILEQRRQISVYAPQYADQTALERPGGQGQMPSRGS